MLHFESSSAPPRAHHQRTRPLVRSVMIRACYGNRHDPRTLPRNPPPPMFTGHDRWRHAINALAAARVTPISQSHVSSSSSLLSDVSKLTIRVHCDVDRDEFDQRRIDRDLLDEEDDFDDVNVTGRLGPRLDRPAQQQRRQRRLQVASVMNSNQNNAGIDQNLRGELMTLLAKKDYVAEACVWLCAKYPTLVAQLCSLSVSKEGPCCSYPLTILTRLPGAMLASISAMTQHRDADCWASFSHCLVHLKICLNSPLAPSLQTLRALGRTLHTLDIDASEGVKTLVGVENLPLLHTIDASLTDITDIRPLQHCTLLEEIHVRCCEKLRTLDGAGALPNLRVIDASNSGLQSLLLSKNNTHNSDSNDIADACFSAAFFSLRKLDITNCRKVRSLEELENAVLLEELIAPSTGISTLAPLDFSRRSGGGGRLRVVDVGECLRLKSIDALGAHGQHLQTVDASRTAIASIPEKLCQQCTRLCRLDLSHCVTVKSLDGLERITSLEELVVSGTGITSLQCLLNFGKKTSPPRLCGLAVGQCKKLQSLDGIEALAMLEFFSARGLRHVKTLPANLSVACPRLVHADLTECTALSSLESFRGHPRLENLSLRETAISSLAPLAHCPQLEDIEVSDCRHLKSLVGIESLPNLKYVDASYSPVTSVRALLESSKSLMELDIRDCNRLLEKKPFFDNFVAKHSRGKVVKILRSGDYGAPYSHTSHDEGMGDVYYVGSSREIKY